MNATHIRGWQAAILAGLLLVKSAGVVYEGDSSWWG